MPSFPDRSPAAVAVSRRYVLGAAASATLARLDRPLEAAPFVLPRDPQAVAFAPGGTMAATGCSGLSDGTFPPRPHPDVRKCGVVAVWDVATRRRLFRWETFGDLIKLAFSPDGRQLAACRLFECDDGLALPEVRVWDVTTGRTAVVLDRCHYFDYLPNGSLAVLSRSKCAVYDTRTWTKQQLIPELSPAVSLTALPGTADLVGLVAQGGKRVLRRTGTSGGRAVQSLPLPSPTCRVAAAPDCSILATGHDDGIVWLWEPESLRLLGQLETAVRGLAHPFFSSDGQTLAAGCQANGDVVFWRLADRREIARYTFERGALPAARSRTSTDGFEPRQDPARFCFSPDGEAFFVGCYGGIMRATRDGRELARFDD